MFLNSRHDANEDSYSLRVLKNDWLFLKNAYRFNVLYSDKFTIYDVAYYLLLQI